MAALVTDTLSTAEEFIDRLSKRRWNPDCVFRGHGDASWKLLPSAWRPQGYRTLLDISPEVPGIVDGYFRENNASAKIVELYRPIALQIALEAHSLIRFVEVANSLGLHVPALEYAPNVLNYLQDAVDIKDEGGGLNPKRSSYARFLPLPQHHGVPTRLLDWTYHPWTAAFFAALEAFERNHAQMAVWILETSLLEDRRFNGTIRPVTVLRPLHAEHSYLHAQNGLFTFDNFAENWFCDPPPRGGQWQPLDLTIGTKVEEKYYPRWPLRRLLLPGTESAELLRLLAQEGFTQASLMPTHDNVFKTLTHAGRVSVALGGSPP